MVTVENVISWLVEPVLNIENTVDVLLAGHAQREVKGIATTFMPSYNVLMKAVEHGMNLVIAHEAPFYQHRGKVDILERDSVYKKKKSLIEESGIAIFRFHDHMHRVNPDQIVTGLVQDLGWSNYLEASKSSESLSIKTFPLVIPVTSVGDVAQYVKERLNIPFVRVVGSLSMQCSRIGILPGYCGGASLTIPFFQNEDLDLIITGEGPEWETPEYVRDAVAVGEKRALLILGHGKSEESGMKYLAESLRSFFSSVPVEFISEEQPFTLI